MRLVLALSLALCAVLLPSADSLAVMSIDIGNEYLKIAIVKPGVPMEIVLNVESQRKTATIVSMRGDDRQFGNAALNTATKFPANAYMFLRELLAKSADNPIVQAFSERFPHYKLENDDPRGTFVFEHPTGEKYSPEELLAMILEQAREYASAYAEQPVSDAVLVIPAYFTQAERRSVLRCGKMAGIKVLQLMTNGLAVGLNYGIFRRKEFNSTAQYYMFVDMGSTSTTATIVKYQVVKQKVGNIVETNPQVSVVGVGFDRTLGSLEMTVRIRDYLGKKFNALKKTSQDVFKNKRSMAKLFKEAGRVKKVLGANTETFAQVENLLDDQDMRIAISRAEMEAECADLYERISGPVNQAFEVSEMTEAEMEEVILMGGATRAPKAQEILKKVVKREELGKSINTDESAAMGAVYQAAHLSKGFKVMTFLVKDANVYPIQVEFERTKLGEDGEPTVKTIQRTLFNRLNPYPQKKVMTFNKQFVDFDFFVNYAGDAAELGLPTTERNITSVAVSGVPAVIEGNSENDTISKGVKAHFVMDDSGVLTLDVVEYLFEKPPAPSSQEESTFSKLSNTISNFFSAGTEEGAENSTEGVETEGEDNSKTEETPEQGKSEPDSDKPSEEKPESTKEEEPPKEKKTKEKKDKADKPKKPKGPEKSGDTSANKDKEAKKNGDKDDSAKDKDSDKKEGDDKEEEKESSSESKEGKDKEVMEEEPKIRIVKAVLTHEVKILDVTEPDSDAVKASHNLVGEMKEKDVARRKLEKVSNELESFVFEVRDKLREPGFENAASEEEKAPLLEKLTELTEWVDEQGKGTTYEEYSVRLTELKKMTKKWFDRVREGEKRPQALEALRSMLNHSSTLYKSMQNYTGEDGPFTEVEMKSLGELINETKTWRRNALNSQKKKKSHEDPAFTFEEVGLKLRELDRELKYLLNKAKVWVPPKKPTVTIIKDVGNDTETAEEKPTGEEAAPEDSSSEGKGEKAEEVDPVLSPTVEGGEKVEEGAAEEVKEEETLQLEGADASETTESVTEPTTEGTTTAKHGGEL